MIGDSYYYIMFRHCLVVVFLVVAVTVSSFAPSLTKTRRLDRVDVHEQKHRTPSLSMASLHDEHSQKWHPKGRTTKKEFSQRKNEEQPNTLVPTIGREILAASLIFGSFLFVFPNPAAAMTPDFLQQPTRTAETKPIQSTSISTSKFLTISDELKIQPKYLDLAGDLKEELKFRAKQGKEKVEEKAKEVQEKQQIGADKRAAKNKEYDDMFDQAEIERNEYYSQRIISRDTYLQKLREDESKEDRSEYNKMMTAISPEATPIEYLRYKILESLKEENSIRAALAENKLKDQDDRETKVERTLLRISLEKAEQQTAKLRKDINLEESLETIKLQRQAEARVYQERAEIRERGKQESIENIRLIKEREQDTFEELRARKKEEAEELKFNNAQIMFDRRFDDLDRFEERKGVLAAKEKQADAAKLKDLRKELNQLAVEGATENVQGQQTPQPPTP